MFELKLSPREALELYEALELSHRYDDGDNLPTIIEVKKRINAWFQEVVPGRTLR